MGWVDNASPEVEELSDYRLIIAISVFISVISISVVCARLYVRHTNHGLGADDHMAALSMFFALLYSIICIVQTKYGLGLPLALRPKPNLVPYTRWNYAGRPIYQMGISFFKVALLISYLRLFQGTSYRGYRATVWITIVAVVLGHLGCSLCLVLACNPVYKSWEPLASGTCLAPGPSFTGYAIVTIVSDIAVTIIPLPVLIKLNVSRSKKIGLVFIFVLGLFTTICSVLRYLQIDRIQYGDGNSTMLILWGVIEFNVGVSYFFPTLAPFFSHSGLANVVAILTCVVNKEHGLVAPLPRSRVPPPGQRIPLPLPARLRRPERQRAQPSRQPEAGQLRRRRRQKALVQDGRHVHARDRDGQEQRQQQEGRQQGRRPRDIVEGVVSAAHHGSEQERGGDP